MLIYFAAPLFCQAERAFNLHLAHTLESHGFAVFLPQRDGIELANEPYRQMSADDLCKAIFVLDRDKILESDIFLFILDGRVPDEGACVELGIAYTQKYYTKHDKLLIGMLTDLRGVAAIPGATLNAMLAGALDSVVSNEIELIAALEQHCRNK